MERELLLDELAKTHDYFLSSVAENRQITSEENLGIIASARVFLGSEALELGLVDVLGGRKEAEDWLKEHTNLTEINYISYERKPFFNIGGLAAEQASIIGRSLGHSVATTLVWSGSRPLETLQT